MIYDQNELQTSIEEGERKLAMRRQQHRAQKKRLIFGAVVAGVLVPLGLVIGVMSRRAPAAPLVVVTWPKPKIRQVLAPMQTVLARAGQPFEIEITEAENWDVTWRAAGIESSGSEFSWAPVKGSGELLASCRARVVGVQKLWSWTWPRRELVIRAVAARKIGDYGRAFDAGRGTWVYPHILARGKVGFDERALPLLARGAQDIVSLETAKNAATKNAAPENAAPVANATVVEAPPPPIWDLVGDFEGGQRRVFADIEENGTFAALRAREIENSLPKIAGDIASQVPNASVKFVLRLDKKPAQGVLRLAFDDKNERRAWVRRSGESAGGPLTGWEGAAEKPGLPPSLPVN